MAAGGGQGRVHMLGLRKGRSLLTSLLLCFVGLIPSPSLERHLRRHAYKEEEIPCMRRTWFYQTEGLPPPLKKGTRGFLNLPHIFFFPTYKSATLADKYLSQPHQPQEDQLLDMLSGQYSNSNLMVFFYKISKGYLQVISQHLW